jgi:hypothetical protein
MKIAIENRQLPGISYIAVAPDFVGAIRAILNGLDVASVEGISFSETDSMPGLTIFTFYTPEGDTLPEYHPVAQALQNVILEHENKQEGYALMEPPVNPRVPWLDFYGLTGPEVSHDKVKGFKFLKLNLTDFAAHSPRVMDLASNNMSLTDLFINDIIDNGVRDLEDAWAAYSESADTLAEVGTSIKAFYHPLMFIHLDRDGFEESKAALKSGIIEEGLSLTIPTQLLDRNISPFLKNLREFTRSYKVEYEEPWYSLPENKKDQLPIQRTTSALTKSASGLNKTHLLLGTAVAAGIVTAVVLMRRRS